MTPAALEVHYLTEAVAKPLSSLMPMCPLVRCAARMLTLLFRLGPLPAKSFGILRSYRGIRPLRAGYRQICCGN
jgi:hypothetical protein